jgi:hypothetical protein
MLSSCVGPAVMYCDTVAAFTRFLSPVLSAKIHSAHPLGRPVIHRLNPTPCNKQGKQQTRCLHAFRLSAISASGREVPRVSSPSFSPVGVRQFLAHLRAVKMDLLPRDYKGEAPGPTFAPPGASPRIERVRHLPPGRCPFGFLLMQMLTSIEYHVVALRHLPNCSGAISNTAGFRMAGQNLGLFNRYFKHSAEMQHARQWLLGADDR